MGRWRSVLVAFSSTRGEHPVVCLGALLNGVREKFALNHKFFMGVVKTGIAGSGLGIPVEAAVKVG